MGQLKVGIVGPEEWKLGSKAVQAYSTCGAILSNAKSGILVKSMDSYGLFAADFEHIPTPEGVTLVSGRCPVSVCDACGRRSFLPSDFPVEGTAYTECEFCGKRTKRRAGGIDIYAEQNALTHRHSYATEIFPPEINEWPDKHGKAGYRTRNIRVAKASDILFVVVTKASTLCKHCGLKRPPHISNGGCWTGIYATEVLKKRVVWVII
ncbi:MAG: hypothetical protein JRN62_03315 [Nitrososphaerota archaeon]|jgi:hypothetical protein|nr:hypothetical protein [Nitrososphaerota archaeon]MDG6948627.1 hypothetical protein [Nitrososphaerota archaeon]